MQQPGNQSAAENGDRRGPTGPWDDLSVFPAKPGGIGYAYLAPPASKGERPVLTECSREELEHVAARGAGTLVAVPGHDRLVPPACARELWPAIAEGEALREKQELKGALVSFSVFGAIAAYSYFSHDAFVVFVLFFFVVFGLVPLVQAGVGALQRVRGTADSRLEASARRTLFAYWLGTRDEQATKASVYVVAGIYALQVLHDAGSAGLWAAVQQQFLGVGRGTIEAAALVKDRVRDGEVWRLVTCGFLHGSFIHIFFNANAFRNVGQVLEALFGPWVLCLTFLVSVVAGSLASTLMLPGSDSVGASGGIMGLVGFLLVAAVRHRGYLPPDLAKSIVRSVVFIGAIGLVARQWIDNPAHLGGLLAGCALAVPLTADARAIGRGGGPVWVRVAGMGAAGILVAAAVLAAVKVWSAG